MARKAAGFRYKQDLARQIGVDPSTIGRYERNQRQPERYELGLLVKALGVTETWLMTGTGPMAPVLPSSTAPSSEEDLVLTLAQNLVGRIYFRYTPDSEEWRAIMLLLRRLAGDDDRHEPDENGARRRTPRRPL